MLASRFPSPMAHLLRQSARPTPFRPAHYRSLCNATPARTSSSQSFLRSYRLAVAASLPAAALTLSALDDRKPLQCASDRSYAQLPAESDPTGAAAPPPQAESIINLRDLSFGTVSGICVGIFVKKGLKAAAFVLGGVFVLMQYLSSRSLITVNWSALTSSYDAFLTQRAGPPARQGGNRLAGLWAGFIDFVGANVQSRATFVAGVMLGLRVG